MTLITCSRSNSLAAQVAKAHAPNNSTPPVPTLMPFCGGVAYFAKGYPAEPCRIVAQAEQSECLYMCVHVCVCVCVCVFVCVCVCVCVCVYVNVLVQAF